VSRPVCALVLRPAVRRDAAAGAAAERVVPVECLLLLLLARGRSLSGLPLAAP
jgi:hypothetical protein